MALPIRHVQMQYDHPPVDPVHVESRQTIASL